MKFSNTSNNEKDTNPFNVNSVTHEYSNEAHIGYTNQKINVKQENNLIDDNSGMSNLLMKRNKTQISLIKLNDNEKKRLPKLNLIEKETLEKPNDEKNSVIQIKHYEGFENSVGVIVSEEQLFGIQPFESNRPEIENDHKSDKSILSEYMNEKLMLDEENLDQPEIKLRKKSMDNNSDKMANEGKSVDSINENVHISKP